MSKVYHRILQIVGNVIAVEAEGVAYNELAEVSGKFGSSLAQVIRLQDKRVYLQVFAGSRGIGTGDEVRFLGHQMQVSGSDDLLGRIFNGRGAARDNRPPVTDSLIDIGGPSVNPAKRVIPRNMIRTGIPMIDVSTRWSNRRSCRSSRWRASPTTNCWRGSPCRRKWISSSSAAWD